MGTSETTFEVDGVQVHNPRGRKIQAVMFVRWPFVAPKTLGGVPCLPSFGGWRVEPVSAGIKLSAVVNAARAHGAQAIEVHAV